MSQRKRNSLHLLAGLVFLSSCQVILNDNILRPESFGRPELGFVRLDPPDKYPPYSSEKVLITYKTRPTFRVQSKPGNVLAFYNESDVRISEYLILEDSLAEIKTVVALQPGHNKLSLISWGNGNQKKTINIDVEVVESLGADSQIKAELNAGDTDYSRGIIISLPRGIRSAGLPSNYQIYGQEGGIYEIQKVNSLLPSDGIIEVSLGSLSLNTTISRANTYIMHILPDTLVYEDGIPENKPVLVGITFLDKLPIYLEVQEITSRSIIIDIINTGLNFGNIDILPHKALLLHNRVLQDIDVEYDSLTRKISITPLARREFGFNFGPETILTLGPRFVIEHSTSNASIFFKKRFQS